MFISYTETKFGYDSKTKFYSREYRIFDSDFEHTGVSKNTKIALKPESVAISVIDTYEKRNLNVAANLFRAFIWLTKKYNRPISYIVNLDKQFNLKFAKYEEDLNKYLMLM